MSSHAPEGSPSLRDAEHGSGRSRALSQDTSETSTEVLDNEKQEKSQSDVEKGRGIGAAEQQAKEQGLQPSLPEDKWRVYLDETDDPIHIALARRWLIVLVICSASLCATFASSVAAFTEEGLAQDLHTIHEVTILSVSLYVLGLGVGPLLIGPLSEVYGRNIIYRVSYVLFFAFTWPTAFAKNIVEFLIFRFITGFSSSAFLSVASGSVSDLFPPHTVANPMAVYAVSPFIGPVLGPLIGGFIVQNTSWRWAYRLLLIWQFVELVMLVLVVPETYEPVLLKQKAALMRKETGNDKYWAPLDRRETSISRAVVLSCYTPFKLLLFDRMALALDSWTALILGILYLAFQAFPIIFEDVHGFSDQETGLSFLGIGIGMFLSLGSQPLWNRYHRTQLAKHNGAPPPETRLVMGMLGGVLAPIGLFWLAFTTYRAVPWIVPIIASIPFGAGVFYIFTSVFTYLVVAYRPIAASAMAANTFLRCSFAAGFPLFAGAMYDRLGTVGATALLAGLTTVAAPLPFIFYRIGARLRAKSQFAA